MLFIDCDKIGKLGSSGQRGVMVGYYYKKWSRRRHRPRWLNLNWSDLKRIKGYLCCINIRQRWYWRDIYWRDSTIRYYTHSKVSNCLTVRRQTETVIWFNSTIKLIYLSYHKKAKILHRNTSTPLPRCAMITCQEYTSSSDLRRYTEVYFQQRAGKTYKF